MAYALCSVRALGTYSGMICVLRFLRSTAIFWLARKWLNEKRNLILPTFGIRGGRCLWLVAGRKDVSEPNGEISMPPSIVVCFVIEFAAGKLPVTCNRHYRPPQKTTVTWSDNRPFTPASWLSILVACELKSLNA